MFRNSVATESSGEWASVQDTLVSTDSDLAPAKKNDSSTSTQVDQADTSSHVGSHIADSPPIPPSVVPSKLAQSASLTGESLADPTYEIHVRTDELSENKAQSSSNGMDNSQLSPLLMSVRRFSESQPDIQAQSTMSSPPASQNILTHAAVPESSVVSPELPSQYSQESYHVPTAHTPPFRADDNIPASFPGATTSASSVVPQEPPSQYSQEWHRVPTPPSRTDGDIPAKLPESPRILHQNLNSNPPQIVPPPIRSWYTPLRQSANAHSVHYGTPSRPNRPQSAIAPQLYSSGPTRPIVPQSAPYQSYNLPNAPTPQAQSIHVGTPQRFSASPYSYSLSGAPTPQSHTSHAGTPQQFVPQSAHQFYNTPNTSASWTQPSTSWTQPSASWTQPSTSWTQPSNHVGLPQGFVPLRYTPHSPPSNSYGIASDPTPPTHSSHTGTSQQSIPQSAPHIYNTPNTSTPQVSVPQSASSYYYSIPNTPTPQAQSIHVGTPQSFTPQPHPFSNASYHGPITHSAWPQTRRRLDSFVANDPFQASHGGDKINRPSDALTFDDIPTPISTPEPKFSLGMGNSPYGSLPIRPTSGGIIPPSLDSYPYSHSSTQPGIHPAMGVPASPIIPGRSSWASGGPYQHQAPIIPGWYDGYGNSGSYYNNPVIQTVIPPPSPPSSTSSTSDQPVQPQPPSSTSSSVSVQLQPPVLPPVLPEPYTPSNQYPIIIESKSDDGTGTDESSIPYIPPYPLDSKYKPPEPAESIFSRITRFFRWSPHIQSLGIPQPSTVTYPPIKLSTSWREHEFTKVTVKFIWVTLPMQVYLYFLLRLPALYFSRVARIFEEAGMALPDIKKMALETASQGLTHEFEIQMAFESSSVPPAYKRLTSTWEFFIDSVMREWKTFNIISVLLLTAILTILQIESAASDPLTRYTALFSLMCALISLLFGCMYIIRFGSMRKTYKAAEWALEATQTRTIWWNVWVLLAMPAIWLTWSILLYIACIMSFVWRSAVESTTTHGISHTELLAVRIVISVVLGLGMIYAILILTTFRRYGTVMDKKWKQRIDKWIEEKATGTHGSFAQPYAQPSAAYTYPGGSTVNQGPTYDYDSSPYYQPPSGDPQTSYGSAHDPRFSSENYVQPPGSYWRNTDLPHNNYDDRAWGPAYAPDELSSTEPYLTTPIWSPDDVTRANTYFNAAYNPSPSTTPPLLPSQLSTTSPGEIPPVVASKKHRKTSRRRRAAFAVPPPPSLPPIPGTPIDRPSDNIEIGSSTESKHKGGRDGSDTSRVRFQSPLISKQGGVNLANKDMKKKVPDRPRESSDAGSYPSDYLEYV